MSTYTTNYNLEKPDSTDDFKDFRSNYNSNMDIIDANLGGGGGGNVDDVLVNGVSVVDGNHDAQITSYKEVTQAEYDTLPATKLTDGIAYFIKDAGGGGGGSSSHDYSTTEQVIGTWIDGKPLYERVFDLGSDLAVNYNAFTDTTIDASVMETLIEAKGIYSTGVTVYNLMANINNNIIRLQADRNGGYANVRYIILQYTKTTDV